MPEWKGISWEFPDSIPPAPARRSPADPCPLRAGCLAGERRSGATELSRLATGASRWRLRRPASRDPLQVPAGGQAGSTLLQVPAAP